MSPRSDLHRAVFGAVIALGLSACAVGPDFTRPAAPETTQYTSAPEPIRTPVADGTAQKFKADAVLPADWWRLFDCPKLDAEITQAIAANPTIESAAASLRTAEDNLRAGYGVFYPQVSTGGTALRERGRNDLASATAPPGVFSLYTISATVSYVLDVFGGERRMVEVLGAQTDYQRDALHAAYLSLAANVVNTTIAEAAYAAEIDATNEILKFETEELRLGQVQLGAGTMDYAAVLSLTSEVEATKAQLPQLRQKQDQARHLLATLSGRAPSDGAPEAIDFAEIKLPPTLPLSLPSDLVRQRPDIRQAEAALHAASAEIGVATAAMLPSITLDGNFGYSGLSSANLMMPGNKFWSVGAGVTTPVFEGGNLWFKRRASIDAFDQARATYRQTVLAAFEQVADNLRALEHDAEALTAAERSAESARRALTLVRANFASGITDYTALLVADAQFHQSQILVIELRATRYQDTVALFAALGGGWWNAE